MQPVTTPQSPAPSAHTQSSPSLLTLARQAPARLTRTGLAAALRRRLSEIEACRSEFISLAAIATALVQLESLRPVSASRLTAAYCQLREVREKRGAAFATASPPPQSSPRFAAPVPMPKCSPPNLRDTAAAIEARLRDAGYRKTLALLSKDGGSGDAP